MAGARDSSELGSTGYGTMKQYHDRAYSLISVALDMDESGEGEKERVIDLYSQGATHLERGVSMELCESDEDYERTERLRQKMKKNLDMATGRVEDLLDGKNLKGRSPSGAAITDISPTQSLANMKRTNKRKSTPLPLSVHKKQPSRISGRAQHVTTPTSNKPVVEVKGVDPSLVETITSEILDTDTSVTWNDVVGLDSAKKALQEIVVYPALNPQLFVGLCAPVKGLLLFGPPGNGKTMLAKAVAHESRATFFSISSSSLTSKYVGEGEKLVKALFAVARQKQPAVVFIDEVDALLSRRGQGEHDAMRRLKNEFLMQFDGVGSSDSERVLIMAATNRPEEIDDAALRRFPKRIYIPLPHAETRVSVLTALLNKNNVRHRLTPDQIRQLGDITDGYSASDLTALAKDAAMGPIRELNMESLKKAKRSQVRPITHEDFISSLEQIKPSVARDLVQGMEDWNRQYGVTS